MNGTTIEPRIDPRDERVDVSAKFSLQRMMQRSDMREDTIRLINGINAGQLAGIFGDDLRAAVRVAQRLGTQRWLLVPKGEDAALILDPAAPMTAAPTIIFRRPTQVAIPGVQIQQGRRALPLAPIRGEGGNRFGVVDPLTGQIVITRTPPPDRLDAALQKASRTFQLYLSGALVECSTTGAGAAVTNVVPQLCAAPVQDQNLAPNVPLSPADVGASQGALAVARVARAENFGGAASTLFESSPAVTTVGSINLMLTLNGVTIQGESNQRNLGRADTIECLSYEQQVKSAHDIARGARSGRREYGPLIIRKRIDKSTPLLAKGLTENQIGEGTFKFYRTNPRDGTIEQFYTVVITGGRIIAIKQVTPPTTSTLAAGVMFEEVAFTFQSISWTYPQGGITHQDEWSASRIEAEDARETAHRIADDSGRVTPDTLILRPGLAEAGGRVASTGSYFLLVGGVPIGTLKSVAGGNVVAEVVSSVAGNNYYLSKHLASVRYEDFRIEVGFGMDKSFYEWIKAAWTAKPVGKNGAIVMADSNLNAKFQREFSKALITEVTIPTLDAAAKEPAYMTVKFRPEFTRARSASGKVAVPASKQPGWISANFLLEIGGLDCAKVIRIDPFTVKSVPVENRGEGRHDQGNLVPGKINFPNLSITLAESSADTWHTWVEDFVIKGNNAPANEKNGSLRIFAANKTELAHINFYNLGIYRLVQEASTGTELVPRVKADLYCQRMELVM